MRPLFPTPSPNRRPLPVPARTAHLLAAAGLIAACAVTGCASKSAAQAGSHDRAIKTANYDIDESGMLVRRGD